MRGKNVEKGAAALKEHADGLLDAGRLDEAISEYRALIELDPGDPCSHFGICDAYDQKGQREEALAEIDEAIRLRPGWPYYHNKKGKMLEAAGKIPLARREFEAAVSIKPDLEDARKSLERLDAEARRQARGGRRKG